MTSPHNRRMKLADGSVLEVLDMDGEAINSLSGFLKEILNVATAEMQQDPTPRTILADGRAGPTPCFLSCHRNQADAKENGWMMQTASLPKSQAAFMLDLVFNIEAVVKGDVRGLIMPIHPGEPGWEDRAHNAAKAIDAIAAKGGRTIRWYALPPLQRVE
jgi:hypothetical protein